MPWNGFRSITLFYCNIKIKEENFDWMNGAEDVNMGSDGIVLNMKESLRSKMKETEDEHVSNAHSTKQDDDDDTLPMRTVHANEAIKVPSGRQAEPIKELIDIAHKTNQTAKIMNFPPLTTIQQSCECPHIIFILMQYLTFNVLMKFLSI